MKINLFAVLILIYTSVFAQTPPEENNYDTLEAVEVSEYKEKKPLVVQYEDKTVVNVQESPIMQASANLFDVLKKTPRLYVSPEEDVQIIGLGQAVVLLNGKPVPKQMLYGILPAQIKEIEVMDNPTARFKAIAQSSVIVNVITLESPSNQWYINPSLSAGGGLSAKNIWWATGQIDAGIQLKKWAIRGGYSYMPQQSFQEMTNTLQEAGLENVTKTIDKSLKLNRHNYNIGVDYEINKAHVIALNYAGHYSEKDAEKEYQNAGNDSKLKQKNTYFSNNFSLDYNFTIDTAGKSLDAHFIYNNSLAKDDFPTWILGQPDYYFKENNLQDNFTGSINYEQPFLKSFVWNTGVSIQYTQNNLDFAGVLLNNTAPSNGFFWEINSTLYNTVKYNWKKWTYTLGLSLSEAWSEIKQDIDYKQNQFNWSPEFRVNYIVNEKYNFAGAYNYSFSRPYLRSMLSYSVFDPSTSFVGNPNLKTTETHYFSLRTSLFQALMINGSYTFNQNAIDYLQEANTIRNVNSDVHQMNLSVNYSYQYKFWTMNYNVSVAYSHSTIQTHRTLPTPMFMTTQSFSIPKDFSFDVNYRYFKMNFGNIKISDNQTLDLSLSKRFPKQNIHLILAYNDVAGLGSKFKIGIGETQTLNYQNYNSQITFTARYNFGQELGSKVKTDQSSGGRLGGAGML